MKYSARPRHPVTGRRFRLRASSERELAAYLHRLDSLRAELRLNMKTPEEVDRELRHLRFGPVTLERAALAYGERKGLSRNTRRRVRSVLDTHLADLRARPIASLDVPTVSAWIDALELEPTSKGTVWRTLSAIVHHAVERGWIASCPWSTWKPRLGGQSSRAPREAARSVDELIALVMAARELDAAAFAGGLLIGDTEPKILCAALLGLRQGELAGLHWTDLDEPRARVLIARQYDDGALKSARAPKWIATVPELFECLARYLWRLSARGLHDVDGPIFPSPSRSIPGRPRAYLHGEVLTRRNLRAAVRAAGLPHVESWSAHSLRDTFVTLESAATGGDLRRVADRSRHTLDSLVRYLRTLSRTIPASPAVHLAGAADEAGSPLLGPSR